MSATFTLPVAATDKCNHAPAHSHSHSRSHQRQRGNSRLTAPFPLARIPSESVVQQSDMTRLPPVDTDLHQHSHTSRAPSHDLSNGHFIPKRRDTEKTAYSSPSTSRPRIHRHLSKPTQLLLHSTENYSLLHGILADDESRRIFYFMILNLCFMVVQSTYGVLTGSLGLISDSIHMFFDCVALLVGVCAAVMSKWPPSLKFPYGYGKVDTLAGLGNGIFLMLISIEIIWEAVERLFTGADVSRTVELLVVSTVGLFVNMVGIMAFHGAHGHGHDHGHSHDHHDHDHDLKRTHSHAGSDLPLTASASPVKGKKAASGHHHGSENMQGIYLHIMADALGSVAVVASTLLVRWTGWSGWDPLASCIIAILIFASTLPLVMTTTKTLLLSLNSDIEYNLRGILSGVAEIRGVVGYTVPKFWLEDIKKDTHDHGHGHDHGHDHHGHSHKDSNASSGHSDEDPTVHGVIHVIASQTADLEDIRERVDAYLRTRKMDVVIQMEREGENRCWCGGGQKS
ncbi:CDF family cation efflux system protein [Exophiala viscosa]|uniref:CDF family cation efflux system protein n=1 Tax=Exophiala viscosa TaxID=2486360 RepID=UPI00219819F2|nr:CDF family cation efflux system protein [Exophiala viscosa]